MPQTVLYDLEIPGDSTVLFVVDVVGGPVDLVGFTGRLQIRGLRDDSAVLAEIGPANVNVNAATRQVTVTIPSVETAEYDWRRGVYDLRIEGPGGDGWRLVEGRATFSRAVTREDD